MAIIIHDITSYFKHSHIYRQKC